MSTGEQCCTAQDYYSAVWSTRRCFLLYPIGDPMREYVNGWWSGLSQRGRAIISIVVALCLLAALALALSNPSGFSQVSDSLDKLLP